MTFEGLDQIWILGRTESSSEGSSLEVEALCCMQRGVPWVPQLLYHALQIRGHGLILLVCPQGCSIVCAMRTSPVSDWSWTSSLP